MSDQYVGEIRMWGGFFAPVSWLFCNGGTYSISEYDQLFNLIGTTYGGDGQSTFRVPNLCGRVPIHFGTSAGLNYTLGEQGGVESVTLTLGSTPAHIHVFQCTNAQAGSTSPSNTIPASIDIGVQALGYGLDQPYRAIDAGIIGPAGGNQPHTNMQPYLCVNFIIAYDGTFPPPGGLGHGHGHEHQHEHEPGHQQDEEGDQR